MAFNYGPFAPGEKVIVFWSQSGMHGEGEWYIGKVQKQEGEIVFIESDEAGFPTKVEVSQCYPAYHSDINLVVKKYQRIVDKEKQLYEQLLKHFRENW
jgi:hypothetical protein